MKRLLAFALSASIILLSPGLPAYQALAADVGGSGKADAAPAAVPQVGAPLSLPSVPNVGAGVPGAAIPGAGLPAASLPPAAPLAGAEASVARTRLPGATPPKAAAAASGPRAGTPARASLSEPGRPSRGAASSSHETARQPAAAEGEKGAETTQGLSSALSDSKLDKAKILSWAFDKLRAKASNSLDEVRAGAPSRRAESGLSMPAPGEGRQPKKPLIERVTGVDLKSYTPTEKAYILGQSAFMFGAAIYITSMPLLVKALAGTAADTGLVRMTHYWTLGVASLFAGEIVKRVPMKKVLVGAGVGRAAIYGAIGGLALMGGLHWGLFVGLVGANALLVAHNHIVDMDAAGANKIFSTSEKRRQAFRLYRNLRYAMLLVMPWVLGLGMDRLDSSFGAGTGAKAGFVAFAAMMGLTAWIYQTRLKMAALDAADKAGELAQKLSPRQIAGILRDMPRRNWETLKVIAGNKIVLTRTIMSTAESFLEDAFFFVVLPTFAVESLGAGAFGAGLVLSAMYFGGLLASTLMQRKASPLEKKLGAYGFVALLSVGAAAAFIPSVALWAVPSLWVTLPVVALMKFLLDPIQSQSQSLNQEAIEAHPETKAHQENIFSQMAVLETALAGAGGLAFTWIFKHSGPTGALTHLMGAHAPMKIVTGMLAVFSIGYLASLPIFKKQLHKEPATEPGPLNGKSIIVVGSYLPARSFVFDTAKRLGVDIILVDDPSRREAAMEYVKPENFIPAPVFDADKHDEIIKDVKAFAEARKAAGKPVDGTLAFFDAYTVLNAKLADALGLKGHGVDPIVNTKSKDKTREVMAANSEFAVQFRKVMTEDQAAAAFRDLGHGVLKPPRGAGSQFVAEIRTEEEARAQFRAMVAAQEKMRREDPLKAGRYSVGKTFGGALYEQYLDGDEVDIEIIVQDGVVKLMTVADNMPTEPPYFVETGDIYPSQLRAGQQAELKRLAREAVKLIGLRNGNIHLEAKMTSKGPRIIEINSRMGGDFVYHAMKQTWGVDLVELGLEAAVGLPIPDLTGLKPKAVVMALEKPVDAAGTIESISPEAYEMQKDPAKYGLYRVEIAKGVGDRVDGPPYGLSEKPVNIQAIGKTYEEAKRNAENALSRITIKVRPKGAPAPGVTRVSFPGRAELTNELQNAAASIAARDREKAAAALEQAATLAARAASASPLVERAREAAAALAAGRLEDSRASVEAALALAPAAEEALALAKLEGSLQRMGLPPYRTTLDASPADDDRPTVAMLAPASVYKLSIAREGSRQAPQDYHLAIDPSWFFQDTLPDGTKRLRLRKGLRFDESGQATIVEYAEPRLVRFFANFYTMGANGRDDGNPLEENLDVPQSSSLRLEKTTNDKLLTRLMLAAKGVAVPATLGLLMAAHPLRGAAAGGAVATVKDMPATREQVKAEVEAFLAKFPGRELVVKPSGPNFHSGIGVGFFDRNDVDGIVDHALQLKADKLMSADGVVLIEERVIPPALYFRTEPWSGKGDFGILEGQRVRVHPLAPSEIAHARAWEKKDYNFRVLAARTPGNGGATTGIFARAGAWGKPTNAEAADPRDSAAVITVDEVVRELRLQHGLLKTDAEAAQFKADLEKLGRDAVVALARQENEGRVRKEGEPRQDQTDFIGLDVMLQARDGKLVPTIIEVNDHDSGGQAQLDEFTPEQAGAHSREWVATMLARARRDALKGKRIVVVGAGYPNKRAFLEKARALGVQVVLVDKGLTGWAKLKDWLSVKLLGNPSKDNWAKGLVAEFINEDLSTDSAEAIASAAEKIRRSIRKNGKIDGITSYWEDDVLETAKIAEALGLSYHPVEAVEIARSKSRTIQALNEAGVHDRATYKIEDRAQLERLLAEGKVPPKWFLKPENGAEAQFSASYRQGDILKVYDELHAKIEASDDPIFNASRAFNLTNFLDGNEWDYNVVLQDGKFVDGRLTDNWPTNPGSSKATGSSIPARAVSEAEKRAAHDLAVDSLLALGLRDGVFHVEGIGEDLLEINVRPGGSYTRAWNEDVYGVDEAEMIYLTAARIPVTGMISQKPTKVLEGAFVFAAERGVIKEIGLTAEAKKIPGLHLIVEKKPGKTITDDENRVAMIYAEGKTAQQALAKLGADPRRDARKLLHLVVE